MTQRIEVEDRKDNKSSNMNVSPISGNPGNDESSSSPRSFVQRGNSMQDNHNKFQVTSNRLTKFATRNDRSTHKYKSSKNSLLNFKDNSKSGIL